MAKSKIVARIASVLVVLLSSAATAGVYLCADEAGVSLDQFGTALSGDEDGEISLQNWVVDIDKGWRRADVTAFHGYCKTTDGYVVCKTSNIAFGEATLSIHPDGSHFTLVYMDYGSNVLAFVGKCEKS